MRNTKRVFFTGGGIRGTANQTSSCQHPLSKRLIWDKHIRIEVTRLYPCINAIIKHGYSFWWFWLAHSPFNSYAPELVPMFYYRDKTREQLFYFLIQINYTAIRTSTRFSIKHQRIEEGITHKQKAINHTITSKYVILVLCPRVLPNIMCQCCLLKSYYGDIIVTNMTQRSVVHGDQSSAETIPYILMCHCVH